jgi:hypothetical protein
VAGATEGPASDRRMAQFPWPLDCPATTTHVKSAYGVRKRTGHPTLDMRRAGLCSHP